MGLLLSAILPDISTGNSFLTLLSRNFHVQRNTGNYDSSIVAYDKLVMRPGISCHTIIFLSFLYTKPLTFSHEFNINKRRILPNSPALSIVTA
jgi:hypothetical protein